MQDAAAALTPAPARRTPSVWLNAAAATGKLHWYNTVLSRSPLVCAASQQLRPLVGRWGLLLSNETSPSSLAGCPAHPGISLLQMWHSAEMVQTNKSWAKTASTTWC